MTDYRPAAVWRSLLLRLTVAAIPAWVTIAVLVFSTPWRVKLLVGAVCVTTLVSPSSGLLAAAALAPLGQLLSALMGVEAFRLSEAVVVAFLVSWLLRAEEDRPGPRVPGIIGWLLVTTIVASIASQTWQLGQTRPYRGELTDTFEFLFYGYFLVADRVGFIAGARLLEGLALTVATVALVRQRPRLASQLPIVLVGSAVVAAMSSVLLWYGIAPGAMLARYARIGYRVSAHVPDINAAGSYFAMVVCLAAGAALRARGQRRVLWLLGAAAVAIGLWLSASRSAIGVVAIALPIGAAWLVVGRWKPPARRSAVVVLLVGAVAAGAVRTRLLEMNREYRGIGYRQQFNAASLRMITASPVFGVGVGQYYRMSTLFLSPQPSFAYGFENAHNYFLQIAGELGLVGLSLFVAWLAAGGVAAARALARSPGDVRLLGAAAGVAALGATCLTGHPLLLDEVSYPFWIQYGLVIALAGSVLRNSQPTEAAAKAVPSTPRAWSLAAATAAAIILAAAPVSARVSAPPPPSAAVDGFYEWETAEDGTKFRWSGQYASVFVPANATRVFLPVRMPANIPGVSPIGVEVAAVGVGRGRTFVGDAWVDLNIQMPDVVPPTRYKRIDVRVDRTWQPAIYLPGGSDMRSVGIQVGEPKLLFEY